MKRIIEQSEKDALAALSSEQAQPLLKYILSPLERVALRQNFQAFRYSIDGFKIYISGQNSRRFLYTITHKLDLLTFIENKEHKSKEIPLALREVFDDPAEILGLPAAARNRLCAIECYTMYSAMKLGRSFFINWPGFGTKSLSALDALFSKHNCAHLFV